MENNQLAPEALLKSPNAFASKETLPSFDLGDLYKGFKGLTNPASPNQEVLYKELVGFTIPTALNEDVFKWLGNPAQPNESAISGGGLYAGNDQLSPYKLPEIELQQPSGQSSLDDLNQRITEKATSTVQKQMTPEEKKTLNEDAAKYAKSMEEYQEHMRHVMMGTGGIGLDDPPPNKPESLKKYEQAIDKEIKKIAQTLA